MSTYTVVDGAPKPDISIHPTTKGTHGVSNSPKHRVFEIPCPIDFPPAAGRTLEDPVLTRSVPLFQLESMQTTGLDNFRLSIGPGAAALLPMSLPPAHEGGRERTVLPIPWPVGESVGRVSMLESRLQNVGLGRAGVQSQRGARTGARAKVERSQGERERVEAPRMIERSYAMRHGERMRPLSGNRPSAGAAGPCMMERSHASRGERNPVGRHSVGLQAPPIISLELCSSDDETLPSSIIAPHQNSGHQDTEQPEREQKVEELGQVVLSERAVDESEHVVLVGPAKPRLSTSGKQFGDILREIYGARRQLLDPSSSGSSVPLTTPDNGCGLFGVVETTKVDS